MHVLVILGLLALAGGLAFGSVKYQQYRVNKLADKYNKPSELKNIPPFTYTRESLKQETKNIDIAKDSLKQQSLNGEIKVNNTTTPTENLNQVVKENKNLSKEGKTILKAITSKQNKSNETTNDTELER